MISATRDLAASRQILCTVCPIEIGVESSAVVQVLLAPRQLPNGRIVAGTKEWVCAYCLARGKITRLARA